MQRKRHVWKEKKTVNAVNHLEEKATLSYGHIDFTSTVTVCNLCTYTSKYHDFESNFCTTGVTKKDLF